MNAGFPVTVFSIEQPLAAAHCRFSHPPYILASPALSLCGGTARDRELDNGSGEIRGKEKSRNELHPATENRSRERTRSALAREAGRFERSKLS